MGSSGMAAFVVVGCRRRSVRVADRRGSARRGIGVARHHGPPFEPAVMRQTTFNRRWPARLRSLRACVGGQDDAQRGPRWRAEDASAGSGPSGESSSHPGAGSGDDPFYAGDGAAAAAAVGGGSGNHNNGRSRRRDAGDSDSDGYGGEALDAPPNVYHDLLREYGKSAASVPRHLFTLDPAAARTYLHIMSGGVVKALAERFPAWHAKVLADPNFPFKLLMEETVGMALCTAGVVAARGKNVWNEIDFVLVDAMVGAALSFTLLWLLAPTAPLRSPGHIAAAPSRPGLGGAWQHVQRYLHNLPSSALAPSPPAAAPYTLAQRGAAFLHKGALFAMTGFVAGLTGTALGYGALEVRRRVTGHAPRNRMPPLLTMSLGWAAFTFVSANPRYQLLTGAEMWLFRHAPDAAAKLATAAMRTVNSVAGGATWVMWARATGLNQPPPPPESER
eukprot:ctg_302.g119